MTGTWTIEPVRVEPGLVEVTVDGHPVRVECDDLPLHDTPEAWATAFCLPAARAGATLVVPRPLDGAWLEGARGNVALAASWWGGSPDLHVESAGDAGPSAPRRRWRLGRAGGPTSWTRRLNGPGRALCFTGGIDSFFSLLRGEHRPTHLLFVVGFDVDLDDAWRAEHAVAGVRSAAAEIGAEAVVVRTDLRDHPRFAAISWEHTHGAALATIGHLLTTTIATLVIPPSYANDRLVPWGSRPDLDARWGVPHRLTIEHGDAGGRRIDRVLAIADEPLVQRHLRVCWRNEPGLLNCGRCEKCVRTMAMLAAADALDACETLPDRDLLPAALDALDPLSAGGVPMWRDLLEVGLLAPERAALARLLDRSPDPSDP